MLNRALRPFGAECDPAWFILQVASSRERAVGQLVERFGAVEAWWPTEKVWVHKPYRNELVLVRRAVAPGYLFMLTSAEVNWSVLREVSLGRIHGVLGRDGRPLAVPPSVMAEMAAVPERLLAQKLAEAERRRVVPGCSASVDSGAFAGFVVDVEALDGPIARVVAMLFGRPTLLHVDVGVLTRQDGGTPGAALVPAVPPSIAALARIRGLLAQAVDVPALAA